MAAPNPDPDPPRPRPRFTLAELAAPPLGHTIYSRVAREGEELRRQIPKLYYRDGTFNEQSAREVLVPRASKGYGSLRAYLPPRDEPDPVLETPQGSLGRLMRITALNLEHARQRNVEQTDAAIERHIADYETIEDRWQANQARRAAKLPRLHEKLNRDRSPPRH